MKGDMGPMGGRIGCFYYVASVFLLLAFAAPSEYRRYLFAVSVASGILMISFSVRLAWDIYRENREGSSNDGTESK